MIKNITPVFISSNLDVTEKFWIEVLSFKTDGKHDDYLIMNNGNIEVHFSKLPSVNKKTNNCACYLGVDNLDDLYKKCLEFNCVHPNGKLEKLPWGREFAIVDPDCNLIKIAE
ncbi:VOC family protein [Lacihabitans sp. CS3-21]|uniref:bleomycin resistance protein n=1 Tax=Lacihabitans sp. CS3-21 TaxID=2487332 RepID=UPI0020CF8EC3|nr:VOC family protein [Lacihabitans sp. CS3-21]